VEWIQLAQYGSSCGLLWKPQWTFEFHKRQEISWPTERLLSASKRILSHGASCSTISVSALPSPLCVFLLFQEINAYRISRYSRMEYQMVCVSVTLYLHSKGIQFEFLSYCRIHLLRFCGFSQYFQTIVSIVPRNRRCQNPSKFLP